MPSTESSLTPSPVGPTLESVSLLPSNLVIDLPRPPLSILMYTHPMITRMRDGTRKPKTYMVFWHTLDPPSPTIELTCYTQASKILEWRLAMNVDNNALIQNGTWVLVPPPLGINHFSCKWAFKLKRWSDGIVTGGFT